MGYDISYDQLVGWEADLRLLTERVAGSLFTRPEPRATFTGLVRGLLADVPRKNSWQLAEHVGHGSAYRLEWLLPGRNGTPTYCVIGSATTWWPPWVPRTRC